MEVIKKGLSSFVFHFAGSIISILIQFLAARLLGVEEFGKANYLLGFASTIAIFFYFGIGFYLPKVFQNSSTDKAKVFSTALITSLILFAGFSVFFAYFFRNKLSTVDLVVVLVIALLQYVLEYIRSYLIATSDADKASKFTNLYLRILNLTSLLVLFFVFKNYFSLVISIIFSHLIIVIPFIFRLYKKSKPSLYILFSSKYFYIIQLLYFFLDQYSKVMQGDFFGMGSVSLLSIALLVGASISMFSTNFANVGLPIFAKAYIANDINLMRRNYMLISRVNAFLILPIFLFVFINGRNLLGFINKDYQEGYMMLIFILCGVFFNSFVGPNGSVLLMTGKEKIEMLNGFLKLIVGLIVIYFLGTKYIWGLALALAISEVVSNSFKALELYYYFKILPFSFRTLLYILLLSIIQIIVFYLTMKFIDNILIAIFISILEIILFWILSFKFSINPEDVNFFSRFKF